VWVHSHKTETYLVIIGVREEAGQKGLHLRRMKIKEELGNRSCHAKMKGSGCTPPTNNSVKRGTRPRGIVSVNIFQTGGNMGPTKVGPAWDRPHEGQSDGKGGDGRTGGRKVGGGAEQRIGQINPSNQHRTEEFFSTSQKRAGGTKNPEKRAQDPKRGKKRSAVEIRNVAAEKKCVGRQRESVRKIRLGQTKPL